MALMYWRPHIRRLILGPSLPTERFARADCRARDRGTWESRGSSLKNRPNSCQRDRVIETLPINSSLCQKPRQSTSALVFPAAIIIMKPQLSFLVLTTNSRRWDYVFSVSRSARFHVPPGHGSSLEGRRCRRGKGYYQQGDQGSRVRGEALKAQSRH